MKINPFTYVLFGKEAISIYNISLIQLKITKDVKYGIGKFRNVKKFNEECERWDDFMEIDEIDYNKIQKHFKKNKLVDGLPREKKAFWNFFGNS